MQFVMSNPGPSPRHSSVKKRRASNPAAMLLGNPGTKKHTMAKTKKRRSKAQRAATARMLAANKAKRSGRKQKRHGKRRARRAAKHSGARRSSKRRRRAAKAAASPIIRRVYIKAARKGKRARKIKLQIRRVKATKRRGRRKARGSLLRTIALNPALSISAFIAPIKNVVANLKAGTVLSLLGQRKATSPRTS